MIASVVLGLFAIGLLATLFDTGSDSDDGADAPEEPGFELDETGNLVGTEGDDVITFDEFIEADNPSGILAGGGDDLLDLVPEEASLFEPHQPDYEPWRSVLEGTEIDLGEGDDTLRASGLGVLVQAGAGDDLVEFDGGPSDPIVIEGGDGNDTIDARTAQNASLTGGDGNDLIRGRHGEGGAGYVVEVDGQAGDDSLHVFANEDPYDLLSRNPTDQWLGGEGVDHFIVELNEVIWDMSAPEIEAYSNDDGNAIRLTAASFPDFDPQLETLELRLQSGDDEFTLASVHVEQAGVVVTYDSDTQLDREFLIAVNTDGLTTDQISLEGADQSILVPIAA
ncbi:hypothetical protein J7443_12095 [Tropicibacter sp. R15_0]|uniref:hypothetical protein n=1 Tax=Tropicibacter sp. R15_0 TaxID=2821101 RepID=UPI001ADC5076|nr:hypothetical protein [Tropicibacter sp. R15_0]MBO9465976.1 hypothetical protein [Tropicibacter sp. R15_0]